MQTIVTTWYTSVQFPLQATGTPVKIGHSKRWSISLFTLEYGPHFCPVPAPGTKTLHDMVRVEFYPDFLFIGVKYDATYEDTEQLSAL